MPYEQAEIKVQPGDLLLAFTDGITEPENTYGEEFGEDRMLEVVQRAASASLQVLVRRNLSQRERLDWKPGTPG